MEDGVALVEPAGLGVDEIGHGASGDRRGTIGDSLLVDMVGGAGAVRIEKRVLRGDQDGGAEGGNSEGNGIVGGERGADFNGAIVGSKIRGVNLQAIEAKREIADDGDAGVVGGKGAVELDGVARKRDGSLNGLAVRTGDFQPHLAAVALRKERPSNG
jgi:hypothetical protein